jgi:hypothetical protein
VITVGSFHSGTKHNIISDRAHLQLTVRNDNLETRKILPDGIKRVAVNMDRRATGAVPPLTPVQDRAGSLGYSRCGSDGDRATGFAAEIIGAAPRA